MDFVGVGGEVHHRPRLELEQRRLRVAVFLILLSRVAPVLPGPGILQLAGRDRQTVQRKHHVHRVVLAGMAGHLPGHREAVLAEEREHVVVEGVRRLEIREAERLTVELEAVTQAMQHSLEVQLLDERVEKQLLQPRAVQLLHFGPELRLGLLNERENAGGEERARLVPFRKIARLQAGFLPQDRLDVGFERLFVGLRHVRASR